MSFVDDLAALVAASTNPLVYGRPDWPRRKLGEVARIVNGYPFQSSAFNSERGHPLARIRDVLRGWTETFFDGPHLAEASIHDGDLLIGMDGDFNVGCWHGGPALLNQRVCKVVADPALLDARFLFYVLPAYLKLINDNTPSTTVKHLSSRTLASVPLPLPPLDTQRRIVARVDELFSDLDDGEEELARARADLSTYRKSLLKAAVTGDFTADWRAANLPAEHGTDLLTRILADRKARWTADQRNTGRRHAEPAAPDMDANAHLPHGWAWAGIEQLTTGGIRNGLSLKESSEPTEVKGLRLDALQPRGVDWERTRYLPISIARAAPYRLRSGDLLISRANGSPDLVGRCSLVTDSRDDTIFPDTAIRYPLWGEEVIHRWVSMAWSAPQTRARMLASAKTTAGILKISQGDIATVPLPLPPLAELREIVRRYDATLAETEAGWLEMRTLASASATLRHTILAAAFRGALI